MSANNGRQKHEGKQLIISQSATLTIVLVYIYCETLALYINLSLAYLLTKVICLT